MEAKCSLYEDFILQTISRSTLSNLTNTFLRKTSLVVSQYILQILTNDSLRKMFLRANDLKYKFTNVCIKIIEAIKNTNDIEKILIFMV